MTQDLIQRIFLPHLASAAAAAAGNDFARLALPAAAGLQGALAVSTDSHIVTPAVFPGRRYRPAGCVRDRQRCGMSGAVPLFLTAGFILEEGLPVETLERVVASMQAAAAEAGVMFVAGDTKVAEKGKADGCLSTPPGSAGSQPDDKIGGEQAQPGDVVLVSGTMGDHGIAVLGARGELGFETSVQSDVAPLNGLIQAVLAAAPHVTCCATQPAVVWRPRLNEIAVPERSAASGWMKTAIPVHPAVQAACEMLGFDPLYVANEGKVIVIVPESEAEAALAGHAQPPLRSRSSPDWRGPGRPAQARPAAHPDRRYAHPGCAGRRNAPTDLLDPVSIHTMN